MDNQNQTNPNLSAVQQSKATNNAAADTSTIHTVSLQCSIRRKSSLIGLPGTDPNDRVYKIGSSLDIKTGKNLKGISDVLEQKFMPAIIGINYTDNNFQTLVNEYWGNISVFVPADDPTIKAEEQGKVLKINLEVKGTKLKDAIENEIDLVSKINLINKYIEQDRVTVPFQQIPDYILLCYCLKYNRVARDISFVNMSPKIYFYIYNKSTAIKMQLTSIELRSKAIDFFRELKDNEEKLNQILVMFNLLPTAFESLDDKLIALDYEYNKSNIELAKFVEYMSDPQLETKYLIIYATKKGKLTNPSNTEAYYYNQVPLGKTLNEAILYLNNTTDSEAIAIKETLKKELKY